MNVEIISVGTEILLGDIVNLDAKILSEELAKIGLNVLYHTVVGDNPERLSNVLKTAEKRVDIIITTGGLGPTYDDLTKEIIAKTFDTNLVFDKKSYDEIEKYFANVKKEITSSQKKQAMLPENAVVFYNNWGTAPGCAFEKNGTHILMLPGPPSECEPMFKECATPYLSSLCDAVILSKNLKIFGMGEAYVEELLRGKMVSCVNPSIAPYAKENECLVRITAKARTIEEANAVINPIKDEIYKEIGQFIYGEDDDDLAEIVVKKLAEKNLTIATAESCTGGLLSKKITDISGSSSVFSGSVCSYSNQVKTNVLGVSENILESYGAVSEQTACDMALGVTKLMKSDVSVAITGIAGPTGGTPEKPLGLVYICVFYDGKYHTVRLDGYKNRKHTRAKASLTALDMVRKLIEKGELNG